VEVPAPETALSTADLGTVPVVAVGLKDTSLRIIDLETGAERATFHLPEAVTSPAAVGADRSGVGMGLDLSLQWRERSSEEGTLPQNLDRRRSRPPRLIAVARSRNGQSTLGWRSARGHTALQRRHRPARATA